MLRKFDFLSDEKYEKTYYSELIVSKKFSSVEKNIKNVYDFDIVPQEFCLPNNQTYSMQGQR